MKKMSKVLALSAIAVSVLVMGSAFAAEVDGNRIQNADKEPGNWMTYHGSYKSYHYSGLDQINTGNVSKMKEAWSHGATPGSHLSYSPWCIPQTMGGIKCVVVHIDLREQEPMAWDFLMNFAKDNNLQVTEACLLPTKKPS